MTPFCSGCPRQCDRQDCGYQARPRFRVSNQSRRVTDAYSASFPARCARAALSRRLIALVINSSTHMRTTTPAPASLTAFSSSSSPWSAQKLIPTSSTDRANRPTIATLNESAIRRRVPVRLSQTYSNVASLISRASNSFAADAGSSLCNSASSLSRRSVRVCPLAIHPALAPIARSATTQPTASSHMVPNRSHRGRRLLVNGDYCQGRSPARPTAPMVREMPTSPIPIVHHRATLAPGATMSPTARSSSGDSPASVSSRFRSSAILSRSARLNSARRSTSASPSMSCCSGALRSWGVVNIRSKRWPNTRLATANSSDVPSMIIATTSTARAKSLTAPASPESTPKAPVPVPTSSPAASVSRLAMYVTSPDANTVQVANVMRFSAARSCHRRAAQFVATRATTTAAITRDANTTKPMGPHVSGTDRAPLEIS